MARHFAALDEERPVEREADGIAGARGARRRAGPGLEAQHPRALVGRREQQGVALRQPPRLDAADEDAPLPLAIDILERQAQRRRFGGRAGGEGEQRFDQGRAAIPGEALAGAR